MKIYNMKINGEHFTAQVLEYNIHKAKLLVNGIEYKVDFESEEYIGQNPDSHPAHADKPQAQIVAQPPQPQPEKPVTIATKSIKSPLPGLIMDVKVGIGDTISKGQTIATIEAMKMESDIVADFAGTVAEILIAKGETVKEGQELVTVQSA